MRDDDLPQVQEIDRQSFTMPWPNSAYEYELHENLGSMLWVAEMGGAGKVVGMIVVWLIVDEAHIASLAVRPEYRNQGIASELLAEALKMVIQKNFHIATLEVRANNLAAQNLYRRFGFEVVGLRPRYYRDNGEDALIMTVKGIDQAYLQRLEKPTWNYITGEKNDA